MGKAKRFNTYDAEVDAKRKLVQSYGQQRQNLSRIGSSFRSGNLEPPIAVVRGTAGTGDGTFLTVSMAADQTTNISANNHVEFDTIDEDGGIVLQTGAGQLDGIFELESGKKYFLSAQLRPEFSGATGQLVIAWYDITNSAEIGSRAIYESQTHASHNANQPAANAIITPDANITAEVRIISVTALTALANEYCNANLFEISLGGVGSGGPGSGGGGGGANFPLDYTVDDQGSKGGVTVTHDLSAATAHKLKFTATGDVTLAFSVYPTSGIGIDWYVEVKQDGTGGHAITFPAEVVAPPTLNTNADTVSLVALHTDDNGTIVRAIALLNASPSSGNFATKALDNLSGVALNADIVPASTGVRDLGSNAVRFSDVWTGTLNVGESTDNGSITGTPTRMTYDTQDSSMHHEFEVNNVAKLTIGDTQITALDDISLNGNNLESFSQLNGVNSGQIASLAGGLEYDVDSSDSHLFKVNTANRFSVGASTVDTFVNLDINGNNLDNWLDINGAGTGHVMQSRTGVGVSYDVPTGDIHDFKVNAVSRLAVGISALFGVPIDMNTQLIDLDADNDTSIRSSTDDTIQFEIGGIDALKIQSAGALNWNVSGIDHTLTGGATTMALNLGASTDTFIVEAVGVDIMQVNRDTSNNIHFVTVKSDSNTIDPHFRLFQSAIASDGVAFAAIDFTALNSDSAVTEYANITAFVDDNTSGTEESSLHFNVLESGTPKAILTLSGGLVGTGGMKLGFFDKIVGASQQTSTDTTPTAGATYGTTEQRMIQDMWDALVAYNLLDETP